MVEAEVESYQLDEEIDTRKSYWLKVTGGCMMGSIGVDRFRCMPK